MGVARMYNNKLVRAVDSHPEMDSSPSLPLYSDPVLSEEVFQPSSPPPPSVQPSPILSNNPRSHSNTNLSSKLPKDPQSPLPTKPSHESKPPNRGHWLHQQNKKYHWFLQIHYKHFVNRHMRRMDKIFKTMQIFIGTRQAEQCRSHHQKMQIKHHNFIAIITNLRKQHYNCLEIDPIAEEMANEDVYPSQGLATIAEMKIQEAYVPPFVQPPKKAANIPKPIMAQQQKCQNPPLEQQKHSQEQLNNILDQSHANIGELLLYHEKQDNSCIFNSFFKHDL